jgi:hypothetical protein
VLTQISPGPRPLKAIKRSLAKLGRLDAVQKASPATVVEATENVSLKANREVIDANAAMAEAHREMADATHPLVAAAAVKVSTVSRRTSS